MDYTVGAILPNKVLLQSVQSNKCIGNFFQCGKTKKKRQEFKKYVYNNHNNFKIYESVYIKHNQFKTETKNINNFHDNVINQAADLICNTF